MLVVVAIDPVEDVESAIQGGGHDVGHDVSLGLSRLDDHHELGDQGNSLQVDGVSPHDLHDTGFVIGGDGQDQTGDYQKLDAE